MELLLRFFFLMNGINGKPGLPYLRISHGNLYVTTWLGHKGKCFYTSHFFANYLKLFSRICLPEKITISIHVLSVFQHFQVGLRDQDEEVLIGG